MKRMIKNIAISAFAALALNASVFAEKGPVYISPNHDGVQDNLEIPLKIKEKRYVMEWKLTIENEKGEVVRTIGNKEIRPSRFTVKTFINQVMKPKTGVAIPSVVVWNGVMDNGEVAPDGKYFYYFSATDDNGNSASTSKLVVFVDNTPPEVELGRISDNDKIFGEGSKAVLNIRQSGSLEDKWIGEFSNADGKVVRHQNWVESEPLNFDWDGTDDEKMTVPDGIYNYKITATDRAGNVSNPVAITNIIYSGEKPVTNIIINGSRYFSPNDDGILDSMNFDLVIPVPEAKTGNKLVAWKIAIVDEKGNEVDVRQGSESAPDSLVWSGKVNDKKLPEGSYQAVLTAKYLNGYEPLPIKSPVFILDTIPPEASLLANEATFSPDGDGNQDVIVIAQNFKENKGSPIKNWKGIVTNVAKGIPVEEIDFGEFPKNSYVWNGSTSIGTLAEDGKYKYTLSATDEAGNAATISTNEFALDTSKSEIILAMQHAAFSPNGNGVQDTNKFTPSVKSGSEVKDYLFEIADESGKVVYSVGASGKLPGSFEWDGKSNASENNGKLCPDGKYVAHLATTAENGSIAKVSTQPFVLDTVAPQVALEVPYKVFSKDGESKKDKIPVASKDSTTEEMWKGAVVNEKGEVVKSWTWNGNVPSFEWDGTDEAGNKAKDGKYSIVVSAKDAAGNSGKAEIDSIVLDNREVKAYVTCDTDAISPNGDDFRETVTFNIRATPLDGIADWSFAVVSPEGKIAKEWKKEENASLPENFVWDGKTSDGKVSEGAFMADLKMVYEKGNEVETKSSMFICSVTPPSLSVSLSPKYFSPDNDGVDDDLFISLKGASSSGVALKKWNFTIKDPNGKNVFWSTAGRSSVTPQIVWDGRSSTGELVQSAMDYPYEFTVTDELGLTSTVEGKISVDVLVIRSGNVLKMAVPAIIFRSDNADFGVEEKDAKGNVTKAGITQAQADNNERVLKRIAQILKKFKDYTVTIEGHANNITGTEEEETSTANGNIPLEPLSQKRSEFVKEKLHKYGIENARMTAIGRGGRYPVAKRSDKDNWWKNRRVEFILNK